MPLAAGGQPPDPLGLSADTTTFHNASSKMGECDLNKTADEIKIVYFS